MSVPNIDKLLQYLQCVSKEPIKFKRFSETGLKYEEKTIGDKITSIVLNKTFFDTDSCLMCGGCDPAESNVYTYSEYEHIKNCCEDEFIESDLDYSYLNTLKNGLLEEKFVINGEVVTTWVYPQQMNKLYLPTREKFLERCTWCFQDSDSIFRCRIHPVESITCIMPHLKIFHKVGSNKSSLGISQFGRNWMLKCPVAFEKPNSKEQFEYNKQNRISKLERLNRVGIDLNIETYLPEVIDYIRSIEYKGYENFIGVNCLVRHQKRLF